MSIEKTVSRINTSKKYFTNYLTAAISLSVFSILMTAAAIDNNGYIEHFPDNVKRTWIGPEFWANRLQDWQLANGRIECIEASPTRNVNVIISKLNNKPGTCIIRVKVGTLSDTLKSTDKNWAGLMIGTHGSDYRSNAIYCRGGIPAGITTSGKLFIGKTFSKESNLEPFLQKGIELVYEINKNASESSMTLKAINPESKKILSSVIEKRDLNKGGIALISNYKKAKKEKINSTFWFDDLSLQGNKLSFDRRKRFGPILFLQYTLSRKIMKMNVQMPPIGEQDGKNVKLQIKKGNTWKTIATEDIDPDARTATFRIEKWDDSSDVPYRLEYALATGPDTHKLYYYTGTVRKNPIKKDIFTVGAFTGNMDNGYPHSAIFNSVEKVNPDLLFFSGDQIYERVAGYGIQWGPIEKSMLDYLRKWYIYGWAFGELFRDRPTISIPDDHDVYHGNIWGCGGKRIKTEKYGFAANAQDRGGYKMPARWVKMVERTQTANLPDPFDPTPVKQGIGVYYTSMNYGRISFAITEDRKFKSAPLPLLPKEADVFNGWARNLKWDAAKYADVPNAELLGKRQLDFLSKWVADWSYHADMKVLLSATIFATVATLPKTSNTDDVVPHLKIPNIGEYPKDDKCVADMDSNGWPQTGRNKAVGILRKGFVFHIAGDQHLGTFTKYGLENWRDSSYAFCVPSIANAWPRRWFPEKREKPLKEGGEKYTGDFFDGFGNKVTVYAAANPCKRKERNLDKSPGYGIIELNKKNRNITVHCIQETKEAKEYYGWPITVNQMDCFAKTPTGWLPTVKSSVENPVIKVYKQNSGELVYALRIKGNSYDPPVFENTKYILEISSNPGETKKYKNLLPDPKKGSRTIKQ